MSGPNPGASQPFFTVILENETAAQLQVELRLPNQLRRLNNLVCKCNVSSPPEQCPKCNKPTKGSICTHSGGFVCCACFDGDLDGADAWYLKGQDGTFYRVAGNTKLPLSLSK